MKLKPLLPEDRERALMVADMTTFMAKLVSKLTQAAATHCNNLIKKIDDANATYGGKVAFQRSDPVVLQEPIEFQSNTQLLEDKHLSIPECVAKV